MYPETIPIIFAAFCLALAICALAYLLLTHKRSRAYRKILLQEREPNDVLATVAEPGRRVKDALALPDITELMRIDVSETADTELLDNYSSNSLIYAETANKAMGNIDTSVFGGRYVLEHEIAVGGMSHVFLARNVQLGNHWAVKYILAKNAALANEGHILKQLNHISLPKIVDIFYDEQGVYLVESYIEGINLDAVLASTLKLQQKTILDWAKQLAQVLSYLHSIEPSPIYHFDLKPSNIMLTHDDRLVIIDFGISRQPSQSSSTIGVTFKYAAPEQIKHLLHQDNLAIVEERWGHLPDDYMSWQPDGRTDIYSLGVILFELAMGQTPNCQNATILKKNVSPELCSIVEKCLKPAPQDRYQSAKDLLADLRKASGVKTKMLKTLFLRKLASVSLILMLLLSLGGFTRGYYLYNQDKQSVLNVEPAFVRLSMRQSSELKVEKYLPDGTTELLDLQSIYWTFDDNIARIDGQRIVGLNPGQTILTGQYRNMTVFLDVTVTEPLDGIVDIAQIFQSRHMLGLFSGSTQREQHDGSVATAEFVSPQSLAYSASGTLYLTDAGLLRKITDGIVETIDIQAAYLSFRMVRCQKEEVYILTYPWEEEDGSVYYSLTHLTDNGTAELYLADGHYTDIEDFTVSENLLYFIERNEGLGKTYLKTIDLQDTDDIQIISELAAGSAALTIDDAKRIYIANPDEGTIQVYQSNQLTFFAGLANNQAFIDGSAPLFYMPQRLYYNDGYLYIWDYNTLRRLEARAGLAGECITLAGVVSVEFSMEPEETKQAAASVCLPPSKLMDFAIQKGKILISDPKRGLIWQVE